VLYTTGGIALAVLLSVTVLLIATGVEHRMSLEFPKPTGAFAVGRTTLYWTDPATASPGKRELVAWIWYPARDCEGKRAEYLPPAWREALARNGGVLMTDFLTRDLAQVHVHSCEDADLAPGPGRFPVVILRSGGGALVVDYSALAEDLASHGYVVVGADASLLTTAVVFPDGRVVTRRPQYDLDALPEAQRVQLATELVGMWTANIDFVLYELASLDTADPYRRFTARLDLDHIGIVGHSLGGATAADFCHADPRCKAGIDLDGRVFGPVIEEGLHQPFMFILEDHHRVSPIAIDILAHIQSMYARLPAEARLKISIAGANHFSFSDQILLKSQLLLGLMRTMGVIGSLPGPRGVAITNDYVSTFFGVYLKGEPRAALDSLALKYPEVVLE
jgi:dienelactone hydrolase